MTVPGREYLSGTMETINFESTILLPERSNVCRDITVDEGNAYDLKDKNAWDLADIPWEQDDDGLFDDPDDFVDENKVGHPSSLSPVTPSSEISRSPVVQQDMAPPAPRIMLQPIGVDASGGGQAEENGGENDSDEVEDIPR